MRMTHYDLDQCQAVASDAAENSAKASRKVVGFMSHKSKVYLTDVHDHVEHILSSLDMFASISENLINYTFNVCFYGKIRHYISVLINFHLRWLALI